MVSGAPTTDLPGWLARMYPFSRGGFVTRGGARMNYVDEGPRADEAVVMLHGNPTWSFYYRSLIRELSRTRRCIAPDHIGMGLSDKPSGYDYGLATRIRDIEDLVASLGLKRIHLIVHDWGGAIGMGVAGRAPERVGRIVILNTAAFVSSRIPKRIALCRAPVLGAFLVRGLNGFADAATWMSTKVRRLTWDERKAYLYPYGSWADRVAVHAFVRDIPLERDHRSRPVLEEVERRLGGLAAHPKLIVWGARDFCFDDTFLSRWRECYPDARVERLERAGHYVLEDAGDAATRLISDFLTEPTHP